MGNELYADIIIDISHEALDRVFQYKVPDYLQQKVEPGMRVRVPFGTGNREREGYVVAVKNDPEYDVDKIKEIHSVVEGCVSVECQLIQVAAFMKKRYGSSMIQALKAVLPVKNRVKHQQQTIIQLAINREEAAVLLQEWEQKHRTARARFLRRLLQNGTLSKTEAVRECKLPWKEIGKLEAEGILQIETKVTYRNPFFGLEKTGEQVVLNEEQQAIADVFRDDFTQEIYQTYLLYGVTGSGKTEVYMDLIETVLGKGRQVIVLIPEISLTYQTVRRFYERFGERIAVLHSKMSEGERSDAYERVEQGEADVVIGARSALFAPVKQLGLIIIDEEHDGAYKSDRSPKYHARETAIFRAKIAEASVVLGSATPSVESFSKAASGEYTLWTLTKRAGNARLPKVEVADLRDELHKGNRSIFSESLKEKIKDRLRHKEQVMLFLNRRGFAGFVSCRNCGAVIKCPHCDVSLTYHRNGQLRCHYCGYETAFSRQCPECNHPYVATFGLGTEKAEAALYEEFPGIRVLRMDTDTTRKKNAHQNILQAFSRGEADVLLGTQMIVKGHDYANVTLVGILAADLSLYSQDYRSGERTFQLLCQAAGRAGRGERPGEVVIQTYSPEHYAVRAAVNHSYEMFYQEEMAYRNLMGYPPCSHLMVILVESAQEPQAVLAATRIQKMIDRSQSVTDNPVQILNPGRAAISKLRDVYRQVLYLKHEDMAILEELKGRLEPVLEKHPFFADVQVQFDVDPMSIY